MPVVYAVAVPHPPLIIPQVGQGRERVIQKTIDAYAAAMAALGEARPEALVVASPHSVMYADYLHLSPGAGASGSFGAFGAPQVKVRARYDEALRAAIVAAARAEGLPAGTEGERSSQLDHGTMIPLWFLERALGGVPGSGVDPARHGGSGTPQSPSEMPGGGPAGAASADGEASPALPPIVRIGLSGLPLADHYRLGRCVAAAAGDKRVAFIASGDLSHKLLAEGPYGYAEEGPELDAAITAALADGDFGRLLAIAPRLADRGAECGLRSFVMMAGALDGRAVAADLLSYEGPFGVGYAVAAFAPGAEDSRRRFLNRADSANAVPPAAQGAAGAEAGAPEALAAGAAAGTAEEEPADPWVRLARAQVLRLAKTGRPMKALPPGLPPEMMERRAGVFVSLHLDGELRGCIGTIAPTTASVAEEILQNAVSAAREDPRFAPVRAEEAERLEINVDVLGEAEPVAGEGELDPARYGVIVSSGGRRGLLLPDLEGVDTAAEQVDIARRKAGIPAGAKLKLERFEVVRHR